MAAKRKKAFKLLPEEGYFMGRGSENPRTLHESRWSFVRPNSGRDVYALPPLKFVGRRNFDGEDALIWASTRKDARTGEPNFYYLQSAYAQGYTPLGRCGLACGFFK